MRDTFPGKAEEVIAYLVGKSPLGRIGAPEEIGRIAAFLAGEDSSYIHGVELFADGGASQI
jgi:NAD(P)-dependent dehydrogenase (short-subunit alcohol dehydrogenase family)